MYLSYECSLTQQDLWACMSRHTKPPCFKRDRDLQKVGTLREPAGMKASEQHQSGAIVVEWESRIYAQINGCWPCNDQSEISLMACIIHSIAIKVNDSRFETPDVIPNKKSSVTNTIRSILNKVQ